MSSIKCKSCGLTNFASEIECRRCAKPLFTSGKRPDGAPRRFSIVSLLILAVVAGGIYYVLIGVKKSVSEVNANDANRVASQPAQQKPEAGLSRTEYDRQRAGNVGDAIRNNPSLEEHKKRTEETQKLIQQASNTTTP